MQLNTHKIVLVLAEQQMTHSALAEKCGMSRQSISTILTRGTCSTVTAGKLAKGLQLGLTEIIKEA